MAVFLFDVPRKGCWAMFNNVSICYSFNVKGQEERKKLERATERE
jgi:hypothetical protein